MDLGLTGKVAVVTGGSQGIGLETARLLAEEGARVLICARRPEQLAVARQDILATTGQEVATVPVDVTRVSDLDRLAQLLRDRYEYVDVLINNAGTGIYKPFLEVTEDDLRYGMEINFFAQFRLTQRCVPLMIERGTGVVINVAGASGVRIAMPPFLSSCTGPAKAAEVHLSRLLATELGEFGIRVNCIVPGLVYTEERFARWERELGVPGGGAAAVQEQLGRRIARPHHAWGTARELAETIVYAASDRASYVNGAVLVVDGAERGS